MKPTTLTDDTIMLGAWVEAGRAAITGALRSADGTLRQDVLTATGAPWPALKTALETAQTIGARHVLVLTNDAGVKQALSKPFRAPKPDQTKRHFRSKTDYTDVGFGGDADHWRVLCLLGGVWGGCFNVQLVNDLPGARELWQS